MKYKILLAGKDNTVINDFFAHMHEEFECMTTSCIYDDMYNHMRYFKPDLFVFCPNGAVRDDLDSIIFLLGKHVEGRVPVVLIGADEDCSFFASYAVQVADLILRKPMTAAMISRKIVDFIKDKERFKKKADDDIKPPTQQSAFAPLPPMPDMSILDMDFHRKHILVVDDDALMLKMIKEHLRDNYDVATATSGKTALKFLEKRTTDLILLDYEMPVETGPEVLEKLHANPATKDIPVIFLTGITQRSKITQALAQKPQGYLLKPISRDKLLETIEGIIG